MHNIAKSWGKIHDFSSEDSRKWTLVMCKLKNHRKNLRKIQSSSWRGLDFRWRTLVGHLRRTSSSSRGKRRKNDLVVTPAFYLVAPEGLYWMITVQQMLELISVLVIWKNDDSWGEAREAKALSPLIYGQLKSCLMWREDEEAAATILQHVINSRRVWTQKLPGSSYYECQDVL